MKIAITGASGFIGSSLRNYLKYTGHEVSPLVRKQPDISANELYWDPPKKEINKDCLEGHDAVVNLAGKNLSEGRWTKQKKHLLRESRIQSTEFLCRALSELEKPPEVLISASAIGYYGDRADELLTEASPAGRGFLAELCLDWEQATIPAKTAGIRVVAIRTGIVVGSGGILQALKPIFNLGLGGIFGNGKQWMSWISQLDAAAAIMHLAETPDIKGPVNLVSANPVTNREFTNMLGKLLHRPTVFRIPSFVARLARGEMADEMILASARVQPAVLFEAGFEFQFPDLHDALGYAIQRAENPTAL
jgi:uncharacterized protein (TIGR01777 family)